MNYLSIENHCNAGHNSDCSLFAFTDEAISGLDFSEEAVIFDKCLG